MQGEDPARHERPTPRNKRAKQDDEDDAPTYILEDTNQSMTKEEFEAFIANKEPRNESNPAEEGAAKDHADSEIKSKDKITEVGTNAKKRKAAKIISDEREDGNDATKETKKLDGKVVRKPKKKAKAVKLTFGEEEED
jgi:hypothetical protein